MASDSSHGPKKPHASPLERFPEYVKAIGMITVEMGALEVELVQLLGTMLRIEEAGAAMILFTPRSTRARTEIIGNLAEWLLPKELSAKADRLIKRANRILDKRNEIVHETWGVSLDKAQVMRIPPPYGEPTPVELSQLMDDIQTLRKLSDDVLYFTREVRYYMMFRPHYQINVTY